MAERPADARWARWLVISAVVIALDQLSKWYVTVTLAHGERVAVLPVFSWVRWHNDGAAFSFLSGSGGWQRWFFVALALAFTVFILYELRRLAVTDRLMGVVYGLILGGALGNMIDRLHAGHVVDFILVHYGDWYFPAFNDRRYPRQQADLPRLRAAHPARRPGAPALRAAPRIG